ncbi:hypothetical protein HPB47_010519, partial [Ixodes persulcatus]
GRRITTKNGGQQTTTSSAAAAAGAGIPRKVHRIAVTVRTLDARSSTRSRIWPPWDSAGHARCTVLSERVAVVVSRGAAAASNVPVPSLAAPFQEDVICRWADAFGALRSIAPELRKCSK